MFTRSNQERPRAAFRDVTNANRNNGAGKNAVVTKRNPVGVKTRSMSIEPPVPQRQAVFGALRVAEDRNPSNTSRGTSKAGRSTVRPDPNSYQLSGDTDNIDDRDHDDPLCVTSYVQDMYVHFREKESLTSVRPIYMEGQSHINERMRSILVDWLVEVHLKFKLVPETLYLTVNIIDRFLEKNEVSRPKLQLVGVTSLLIASKYEEIYPPELRDLVYICDRAYTRKNIIDMETVVLKALEYQISIPSANTFLVRFLKAGHADKRIVQLSCYLLDGTLQTYNLLHYLPSQLAAAAVFIARRTVGRNSWSPTLLKYAGYCEEEIMPIARALLAEKANTNPELRAVNKKYSSHRYGSVASLDIQCDF